MNFYKHHIGDYAQATSHLSFVEDAAYSRLLRKYYAEEKPIPGDLKVACRLVAARTKEEKEAVETVLEEFFTLDEEENVWRNKRADEELAKAAMQAETNRRIAEEREARKRARMAHEQSTNRAASGNESSNGSYNEQSTSRQPSHKPDSISQTPDSRNKDQELPPLPPAGAGAPAAADATALPSAEVRAVLDAYHHALPLCQRVSVLNAKRRKRIEAVCKLARQVCRQQGWAYTPPEFWAAYFAECAIDPWMRGEVANPKNPGWKQNLDVLLAEDRFAKVMDQAISAMQREAA